MERKIQNSEYSRMLYVQSSITNRSERCENQESSVSPSMRMGNCKGASDEYRSNNQEDSISIKSCCSLINRKIQLKSNSETQTSEENTNAHTDDLDFDNPDKSTILKQSYNSSTSTPRRVSKNSEDSLAAELSRYKKELDEYNNATRELEQKYMKINVELGAMQQKHERFLANHTFDKSLNRMDRNCSRTCSEFSLKRKYTQVFNRGKVMKNHTDDREKLQDLLPRTTDSSTRTSMPEQSSTSVGQEGVYVETNDCNYSDKRTTFKTRNSSNKDCHRSKCKSNCNKNGIYLDTPTATSSDILTHKCISNTSNFNRIYETIQQAINSDRKIIDESGTSHDTRVLQTIIAQLHLEQTHFRNVIHQQQTCLQDYHGRCLKAKRIIDTQQREIEKLNISNEDLRKEVEKGLNKLRQQLDSKLRDMGPISQKLRDEQAKYDKLAKENHSLVERIRTFQAQSKELKLKLEDISKRKTILLGKLKNAERDLRVYRNYNLALKAEKSRQAEEIQKIREQLENQQATNKRVLTRQRDISDRRCRELQRRIYELEQKLGSSNNSTTGLLLQRDRLITELQSQVNTLVHNFEVSQKHIRVLRRQIVNAAGQTAKIFGNIPQRKNS